ncbi:MAG: hypothetical protein PHQ72_04780 [Hespellia sp.]|nr:hypothetical protein [Hespellia sp.]
MERFQTKKLVALFLMSGFLGGILFANFIADTYVIQSDLFSEYYMNEFLSAKTTNSAYGLYLCAVRILPLLGMAAVQRTRISRCAVWTFLLWTGFSSGLLISVELMNLGILGLLFFFSGLLPHLFFYVLAYSIALRIIYRYPEVRWTFRTFSILCVLLSSGILLEYLANPFFVKSMIKIIY